MDIVKANSVEFDGSDPTKRFFNRVENYLKYRPRYPPQIIPLLEKECGLTRDSLIADIGSGTGFLTELFLRNGNRVLAVEPNAEMRAAGEQLLAQYANFTSVNGTAERTTLGDASVDLVTAGQAFHWFRTDEAKREFLRILRHGAWVVLVWNGFEGTDSTTADFQRVFIRYSTDYHEAVREVIDEDLHDFFSPQPCHKHTFENGQNLDFPSLLGRVLSMSYAPTKADTRYEPMVKDLRDIFDLYQRDGEIAIRYQTPVYYGQLL